MLAGIPVAFTRYIPGLLVGASLVVLVIPAAVVLGARPPGTVDVRAVAARTGGLLLTLLVAFALFAGLVSGFASVGVGLTSSGSLGLVAVAVAAVFEPVRRLVDRAVERLIFGDRLDPVGAASRFAAELSAADDPVAALRELRSMLNLPYAAVSDADGRALVASGSPSVDGDFTLPLTAAGVRVGELQLGLRRGAGPSVRDRPVLRIVVPALAQALRARSLTADVAASRERVVTAVEEDRRRLRRDLHDGLGPTLTGVAFMRPTRRGTSCGASRRSPRTCSPRSVRTPAPPSLKFVGWWTGCGQQCSTSSGCCLRCNSRRLSCEAATGTRSSWPSTSPDDLPELSAATEVAVFRIVTEALTNVARHAGSATARVALTLPADGRLVVEVADDGAGTRPWLPGVGLQSMRERVDQLGGTFDLRTDGAGSRVRATLPLVLPLSSRREEAPEGAARLNADLSESS